MMSIMLQSSSRKKFVWVLTYSIGMLLLCGCVDIQKTQNWRPQTASAESDFELCRQSSRRPPGSGFLFPLPSINCVALSSCMQARGYYERSERGIEMAADVILLPVFFLDAIVSTVMPDNPCFDSCLFNLGAACFKNKRNLGAPR